MGRLPGFDYKRPFYYMVTIKRARAASPAQPAFSAITSEGIAENAITRAFRKVIEGFHEIWFCIAPIHCFVVMPDHLHLLMKIRDIEKRVSLAVVVRQLIKTLERTYWEVVKESPCEPLFAFEWHDWIVKKQGQLDAFTRYIQENPARAWARHQNRQFFGQVRRVRFADREWFAYGNTAILELPVIEPFRCSRKWASGGREWREALERAARIGPGGAGAGTFMSPCEKECGNAIFMAGGSLIVLSPDGFGERWHPPRNKEALCAKGRMLFLSLWEADAAKPDNATLYRRCHEMGDAIVQNSDGDASSEGR